MDGKPLDLVAADYLAELHDQIEPEEHFNTTSCFTLLNSFCLHLYTSKCGNDDTVVAATLNLLHKWTDDNPVDIADAYGVLFH